MSCDPQVLTRESSCFQCLSEKQLEQVMAYLLCQILINGGGGSGVKQIYYGTDADPNVAPILPEDINIGNLYYQEPDITENNLWYWSADLGLWAQIGAGEVICTNDADPNAASIKPVVLTKGAIFYQDPSITAFNEWKWSINLQTWVQTVSP